MYWTETDKAAKKDRTHQTLHFILHKGGWAYSVPIFRLLYELDSSVCAFFSWSLLGFPDLACPIFLLHIYKAKYFCLWVNAKYIDGL